MYEKPSETKKRFNENRIKYEELTPRSPWRYTNAERVILERILETNRLHVPYQKRNTDLRDKM